MCRAEVACRYWSRFMVDDAVSIWPNDDDDDDDISSSHLSLALEAAAARLTSKRLLSACLIEAPQLVACQRASSSNNDDVRQDEALGCAITASAEASGSRIEILLEGERAIKQPGGRQAGMLNARFHAHISRCLLALVCRNASDRAIKKSPRARVWKISSSRVEIVCVCKCK